MTDSSTRDLTQGSVLKNLIIFSIPIFLSILFQQLYNTADTLIVGRYLGTEALAAVSSANNLVFLLVNFFTGMSEGSGIVIAKYFGAKDYTTMNRALHTNMAFGLLSGAVLSVFGYFFVDDFLALMRVDPLVLPLASEYYRIYLAGEFTLVLYNFFRGTMNAIGDSRRPLYYLILSSVLNIGLDFLFIAVFKWGIWSAAAATVVAQFISMALCFIHLSEKNQVYTVKLKKLNLDKAILKDLVHYGFPTGIQNSVIGLANTVVQSSVNSFGMITTAAFGVHIKIEGFEMLPISSFSLALTTFTSQNLGAKQYDRAKKGAVCGIVAMTSLTFLLGLIVRFNIEPLYRLFVSDLNVIEVGEKIEKVVAIFYVFGAYAHSIAAICRGSGRAIVPMTVMLLDWCVFRVIYISVVMRYFNSIEMVFSAYPITWITSSIIFFIYYKRSDWIHGFEK